MVSRRHQSSLSHNTPVRFYKVVALSFLFLTIVLLGIVIFMSSKRATITITTKPDPVDVSYEIDVPIEAGVPEFGITTTSTVVEHSQTFNPTGNKEEPGVAEGMVTLFNNTAVSQVLIPTTRLLTPEGVLFRLKNRMTIPANGSVEADAYADQPGALGNIPPSRFTIPGLPESKQAVIYAESKTPMTGGIRTVGALSDEDVKKAEKIFFSQLEEKAGEILTSVFREKKGVFLTVSKSAKPAEGIEVGDEVSGFALEGSATVIGVFYDEEKIRVEAIKALAERAVSDTDIVEPKKDPPVVKAGEYDENKKIITLTIVQSGRAILNPESKQIEKQMMFGKTREEVRRYLMSQKHVQNVDVQFRPAWMMTVPHVPDHVKVEVKNVE